MWTLVKDKLQVTLRLAVYRQLFCLGAKPLENHDQRFFNWTFAAIVLRGEDWVFSYEYTWPLVKCTYLWILASTVIFITSRHGPTENTALLFLLQFFPWECVSLRSRYPVTAQYACLLKICYLAADIVSLFVSRALSNNGCTRYNT
jgi:hypothetical protein